LLGSFRDTVKLESVGDGDLGTEDTMEEMALMEEPRDFDVLERCL
jgi:hypothetical protein